MFVGCACVLVCVSVWCVCVCCECVCVCVSVLCVCVCKSLVQHTVPVMCYCTFNVDVALSSSAELCVHITFYN